MDIKKESLLLHEKLLGKIAISEKIDITFKNLALLYTPGVSYPCLSIAENPNDVYKYTWKANSIAVISDGSRVLGLGDIGPLASIPLLEGKALIFKKFGNVDAVSLPISQLTVDETVKLIKNIQYSFGGINLEDISTPRCFDILDRLIEELDIPVWHDDQQGTATIIVAALFNAFELAGKDIKNSKIVLFGAGAANSSVFRLLEYAGVNQKQILVFDANGILGVHRKDLENIRVLYDICKKTNKDGKNISIEEGIKGADVIVALSKSGPGVIKEEWIKSMNEKSIVFACANPVPEIFPDDAKKAGAYITATGRSDFPNQVNNALVFPGMFRGALDVRSKKISWGMALNVAKAIADFAKKKGIHKDYIVPRIDEIGLHEVVAKAAKDTAILEGLARLA